ncbi:MAG: Kynureninase [Mycoplasmataceae bacterium]|nr:MAG: Kynureninase [Mycoplasmataceae bacterium]
MKKQIKKTVYKNIVLNEKIFTIWEVLWIDYEKIKRIEEIHFSFDVSLGTKVPEEVKNSGNYEIKKLWEKFCIESWFNSNQPKIKICDITKEEYEKIVSKKNKGLEISGEENRKLNLKDNDIGNWKEFCIWEEKIPKEICAYHISTYQPNELRIESLYYLENSNYNQLKVLKKEEWGELLEELPSQLNEKKLSFENETIEKNFCQEYNKFFSQTSTYKINKNYDKYLELVNHDGVVAIGNNSRVINSIFSGKFTNFTGGIGNNGPVQGSQKVNVNPLAKTEEQLESVIEVINYL